MTAGARRDALVATGHDLTVRMARSTASCCGSSRSATRVPSTSATTTRLTALFDPDGTVDGTFGRRRSPTTSRRWARALTPVARACTCSADPLIDLEAGADTAHLDTYAVVYQVPAEQRRPVRTLGMRYVDDMVRREGTWCIHHRVARMVWMR